MFKSQNKKNSIKGFKLKNIKFIFVILSFVLFFVTFSFAFEIKLGDALDKLQNKIKRNAEIEIGGNAVIDDLYNKSLNQIQKNDMVPMFTALSKTVNILNNDYACQIDKQDVINILYFANSNFKKDLKSNLQEFVKPSRDNMGKSCNKLNVCVFNPKGSVINNTPSLNQNCQSRTEDVFLNIYINSFYIENIGGSLKGSNYFWNNNLEDSSYDIMNDVYMLSKILFQNVEKPVQTLFFKMPSVNYDAIYQDPEMHMDIDWFSPYNNYYPINNGSGINQGSGNNKKSPGFNTGGLIPNNSGGLNSDGSGGQKLVDEDIKDFIESVNYNISNPSFSFAGNQCISGFDLEPYKKITNSSGNIIIPGEESTMTPEEYLESIKDDISNMSCNNDGICQGWETSSCHDCGSHGNPSFDEIESFLENGAVQLTGRVNPNDPVIGCIQKCQPLTCNALNCEKLMCYAQCFCQVYESPVFDPLKNPGLSSVFKIKFCIQPVIDNNLSKDKVVYNIASVFTEIYSVLKKLRNSGELTTNVKTKEFLDSSKKENSFADQLSFSVNSYTKPVVANKSELTQSQEQIELNNLLMSSVLGFSKDMSMDNEKNKYVLMDDSCEYKVNLQTYSTPEQRSRLLKNCKSESKMNISLQDMDLQSVMQDQQVILLSSEFDNFMMQNRDFWYQTYLMFGEWKEMADSLSKK